MGVGDGELGSGKGCLVGGFRSHLTKSKPKPLPEQVLVIYAPKLLRESKPPTGEGVGGLWWVIPDVIPVQGDLRGQNQTH